MGDLFEQTKSFFENLNRVGAAKPYLALLDRDIEIRAGDQQFCISVSDGQLRVTRGEKQSGSYSVVQTTPEVWDRLTRSRLGYTEAGGGMGGDLRCIDGSGSYTDMSWLGILTRLAQENR